MLAAAFGMDPVPGEEDLATAGPGMEALVLARKLQAHGAADEAIARLLPFANRSLSCAVQLAQAYVHGGRVPEAANNLGRGARFQQRALLLEAAKVQITSGSFTQARDTVLTSLPLLTGSEALIVEARQLLLLARSRASMERGGISIACLPH